MTTARHYQIAAMLRLAASRAGIYEGYGPPPLSCHFDDRRTGTRLFFTRDGGMHSSGWFKNPDYERCYHLSLSFRDPETGASAPFDRRAAAVWVRVFFGDDEHVDIMLETIERQAGNLTVWEEGFIESIRNRFNAGGELTEKQLESLERIYEGRMRR